MFFSIVVPLYNKSYSIEKCIDSVLSQSYTEFEIIIINDGSTDDSLSKVQELYSTEISNELIKVINQTNQGVSVARNKGVSISKYDYVCFLDADDEWYPDFLENINKLINNFPSAALYCLQHELKIHSNIKKNKNLYKDGYFGLIDNFFKRSLLGSVANSSKICIRKVFFEEVGGFPVGEKSGEDLFVWMQIALSHPVAFYNKVSSRINISDDKSREGRNISVPYPFVYYSYKSNEKKLDFWAKVYLHKIFITHVATSLKELNHEGFKARVASGKKIFPVTTFLFSILDRPLKTVNRKIVNRNI